MLSRLGFLAAGMTTVAAADTTAVLQTTAVGLHKIMSYTLEATTGQNTTDPSGGSNIGGYVLGFGFVGTLVVLGFCCYLCDDLRNVPPRVEEDLELGSAGYRR